MSRHPRPVMSPRRALLVGGALTLSLVTAACGGSDETASSGGEGESAAAEQVYDLRIGYIPDIHGGGIITAAQENGFWEEAGVQAKTQKFVNGPNQIQALASGDLDFAYIGPGAMWLPMTGQGTVVALDSLSTGDALVAHPDEVGSAEDLKGKKIGVPEGTSAEMILNLALDKGGLTKDDVDIVGMDANVVPTAFLSGQIDVAAPFPPGTAQILEQDPDAEIIIGTDEFYPEYTFPEVWVARNELVEDEPEKVEAFLRAFILANDWRVDNLEKAAELTAKDADAPVEGQTFLSERTEWFTAQEIKEANDNGDTGTWFEGLNSLFLESGKVEGEVSVADYNNTDLFDKALEAVNGG